MPTIRSYRPADLPAVLDGWNVSLPVDPVSPDWFTEYVLLDPNFDPAGLLLAVQDERVVGAAYAVRRLTPLAGAALDTETGWIPFLFVRPAARRAGVGRALLDAAMRFLAGTGRLRVDFACYAPNYFLPGVDVDVYPDGHRLLGKAGFTPRAPVVAMDRSLVGYAIPAAIGELRGTRQRDGYTIAAPAPGELPELVTFAATALAPDWGEAIREAVLRGLPLYRLLVARHGDRIAGFAMYGAYRGIAERFGPYGVAEEARGTGIGAILLYDTLAAMRAEGLHTAWFLWTDEDGPAGRLYQRAGFTVTRRFAVLTAPLSPDR